MSYAILRFAHFIGLTLMGAGLLGVFLTDLRSRQLRDLALFTEAVRNIAVFYDGLVVPGTLLLLGSGTVLIVDLYGWDFLTFPWLAGMVGLFAFEVIEGNTVTRLYFLRLRRLARCHAGAGECTARTHPDLHPFSRSSDPVRHRIPRRHAAGRLVDPSDQRQHRRLRRHLLHARSAAPLSVATECQLERRSGGNAPQGAIIFGDLIGKLQIQALSSLKRLTVRLVS